MIGLSLKMLFGDTRLSEDKQHPIKAGDHFEINDIEARVVGIFMLGRPESPPIHVGRRVDVFIEAPEN